MLNTTMIEDTRPLLCTLFFAITVFCLALCAKLSIGSYQLLSENINCENHHYLRAETHSDLIKLFTNDFFLFGNRGIEFSGQAYQSLLSWTNYNFRIFDRLYILEKFIDLHISSCLQKIHLVALQI
jgi:hypothetical protein